MTSFWGELKRRNVARVAIAYGVATWLLIEVSATTFPMLRLPEWTATLVTVLLLIGFPVALIFAWAYELTPEGLKKEKDVDRSKSITHITGRKLDFAIISVLAIAVGFLLVDKLYLTDSDIADDEVIATERQSIAVLPFVNMSDDPGNEYFSDGLSEEILNLLAKISDLKVIGRTSSFAFKGKNTDLRDIGRALDVTTVLEGSVRKAGNRIRITAQLIDVADGAHIWSETYDRTLNDIFAVQDDVAAAIIDALQIHVGVNPTRGRPTENTEAYALFLKARPQLYVFESRDAGEILLEAIELDPGFAEAYELLAYSYWLQAGTGIPAAEGQKLMGEAAGKALAIDSDLLFAQALFASANIENYSYLREIEAFERTVREAQTNSLARDALITDLTEAGYLREAVGLAEQWVDLDRLSPLANFRLFETLYSVGRTGEAVAALELAHQLGAGSQYWYLGYVNLVEGRDEAAIANIETVWPKDINLPRVRDFVTAGRDPATGQAYLDLHIPQIVAFAPEEDRRAWQLGTTRWYLFLGFLDRYFELILDLDLDVAGYEWTDADELVRDGTIWRRLGFTAHPKYLEVAESIGIVDLWEQRGQPDFCSKSSGQWVCE